jgi:hypothetical protein
MQFNKRGYAAWLIAGVLFALMLVFLAQFQKSKYRFYIHPRVPFDEGRERQEFIDSTFKNIVAAHIFICERTDQVTLPVWLEPEQLIKDTREYIASGDQPIEFSDHRLHEADVRECKYDPVLEQPGNLNFIIKVEAVSTHIGSSNFPLVTVSQFIYRPDHQTSIYSFLSGQTLVFDLSDLEKARSDYNMFKDMWAIGADRGRPRNIWRTVK